MHPTFLSVLLVSQSLHFLTKAPLNHPAPTDVRPDHDLVGRDHRHLEGVVGPQQRQEWVAGAELQSKMEHPGSQAGGHSHTEQPFQSYSSQTGSWWQSKERQNY